MNFELGWRYLASKYVEQVFYYTSICIVYYSSNKENKKKNLHGVRFIASCKMQNYVTHFVPITERMAAIQLGMIPANIIYIYI